MAATVVSYSEFIMRRFPRDPVVTDYYFDLDPPPPLLFIGAGRHPTLFLEMSPENKIYKDDPQLTG